MSVTKKYLKSKPFAKVTFRLSAEETAHARQVYLVGEFNEWNPTATPMQALKNGSFKTVVELESGKEYQYRYWIDEKRWENDWAADKYVPNNLSFEDNSVVVL